MLVKKNGKELKNALVKMDASGKPMMVVPDPSKDKVWQPASEFEFTEAKIQKKTKDTPKKKTN